MYQYTSRNSKLYSRFRAFILLLFLFMLTIDTASAIPAYARKYQSNCSLCHNNVPRLTPFGQKVLENGYQFPGTTDGDDVAKVKLEGEQGPVTLDEISNIMAVRLRGDIQKASFKDVSDHMQEEGVDERWSVEVPKIVNFFFGGTVTKNISYFLESEYNTMEAHGGGETSVIFERGFMQFSNLAGAQGVANVKVGKFDPSSLFAFPTHRQQLNPIFAIADTDEYPPAVKRIPLIPLAFSSKMFGLSNGSAQGGVAFDGTTLDSDGNPIAFKGFSEEFALLPFAPTLYNAPFQTGISVHGRPAGDGSPVMYQVGVALNDKADGSGKQRIDTYAMLRYDFQAAGADVQISGFYYNAPDAARATLIGLGADPADAEDNTVVYAIDPTDINRLGIGVRAQWGEFDVYAAYIQDSIDTPKWSTANNSQWETDASGLSAELDWRFQPKWMFGVRYDYMKTAGLKRLPTMATATGSQNDEINATVQFISPIVKFYPSPNIGLYTRLHYNLSKSSKLPDTDERVEGFHGDEHPASNLENMLTVGVDMSF